MATSKQVAAVKGIILTNDQTAAEIADAVLSATHANSRAEAIGAEIFADDESEILFRVKDKWMISIEADGVGYTYFDGQQWQPGSFETMRALLQQEGE